jgi:hypothetical protein
LPLLWATLTKASNRVEGDVMNIITNRDQAARLARTIISDVAIYNQQKVERVIKNDSINDILA